MHHLHVLQCLLCLHLLHVQLVQHALTHTKSKAATASTHRLNSMGTGTPKQHPKATCLDLVGLVRVEVQCCCEVPHSLRVPTLTTLTHELEMRREIGKELEQGIQHNVVVQQAYGHPCATLCATSNHQRATPHTSSCQAAFKNNRATVTRPHQCLAHSPQGDVHSGLPGSLQPHSLQLHPGLLQPRTHSNTRKRSAVKHTRVHH